MHIAARPGFADRALSATALAAAIVVVVLLTFVPEGSNDYWLQVKVGGMIWNDGELPRSVLFTFTEARDFPFHAHEWLPSVVFYLLDVSLGHERLIWVNGALGVAIFGLCYRLAHRLTSSLPLSLLLALVTMTAVNYRHFLRPEIFACLFVLVLFNLLAEYQLTRRHQFLFWLVPLSLIWANTHGSFPIALVIMACVAAGEGVDAALAEQGASYRARARAAVLAARPYAICCGAMVLAMMVNPYGYRLFVFAWEFAQFEVTRASIVEWQSTFSPLFVRMRGFWAYVGLLALCVTVIIVRRKNMRAADILLLLAFGYLSTDRQRYIVWFALVSLYVLARVMGPLTLAPLAARRLLVLVLVLALAGTGMLLRFGNLQGQYPYSAPGRKVTPELIAYVDSQGLRGNVFNSFDLGAELIYHFYPRLRPTIDSRIDAYGQTYYRYFSELYSDERLLLDFIKYYDVRYMLLLRWEYEHIRQMPRLRKSGWQVLFSDSRLVLLGRDDRSAPKAR